MEEVKKNKEFNVSLSSLIKLLALVLMLTAGFFIWQHFKDSSPVPAKILESVNYSVYYPSKLPKGYKLDKNSFQNERGILLYTLKGVRQDITVTEQALPTNEPLKIPGFNEIQTPAGTALIGTNNGKPNLFLIAGGTLLSISGSNADGRAALVEIAQNMQTL